MIWNICWQDFKLINYLVVDVLGQMKTHTNYIEYQMSMGLSSFQYFQRTTPTKDIEDTKTKNDFSFLSHNTSDRFYRYQTLQSVYLVLSGERDDSTSNRLIDFFFLYIFLVRLNLLNYVQNHHFVCIYEQKVHLNVYLIY